MRALLAATAALLVAATLAGCGVTPPSPTPDTNDDAQLLQLKQSAGIADCPAGQTSDGGLPDKTLQCLGGGRAVDLSTLKGPVLINFWASTCGPCRDEMPALEQFHQKYGDRLPVLGVDTQDTIAKIALQTAQIRGVTYPLLADPSGALQGTPLTYHFLPTTYLLKPDGTITHVSTGGMKDEAAVEQKVEAALGKPLGSLT